jgi:hypothetical protein
MFIDDGLDKALLDFRQRKWIQVEGKILDVLLTESHDNVSKKSVSTFLKYSYTIEKTSYEELEILERNKIYSTNYSLEELTSTAKKRYPPGKAITLRVNPDKKEESTSLPASSAYFYQILFGIAAEAGLLISILRGFKKDKSAKVKRAL